MSGIGHSWGLDERSAAGPESFGPVQEQEDVVVARVEAPARDSDHLPVYYSDLEAFREQTRVFSSVAGMSYYGAAETTLLDADRPVSVAGTWVTGGFFPLLGVTPTEGRILLPSDDVPAAEPVMVISHSFWQRHFDGDPSAVGHSLEWNGKRFTVVGVMPVPRLWLSLFPGTWERDCGGLRRRWGYYC